MALDCKPKSFRFGHPWEAVYELCCEESTTPSVAPTANVTMRGNKRICALGFDWRGCVLQGQIYSTGFFQIRLNNARFGCVLS